MLCAAQQQRISIGSPDASGIRNTLPFRSQTDLPKQSGGLFLSGSWMPLTPYAVRSTAATNLQRFTGCHDASNIQRIQNLSHKRNCPGIHKNSGAQVFLFNRAEVFLAHAAQLADEVFGQVFPLHAGFLFVINPAAHIANIFHSCILLMRNSSGPLSGPTDSLSIPKGFEYFKIIF